MFRAYRSEPRRRRPPSTGRANQNPRGWSVAEATGAGAEVVPGRVPPIAARRPPPPRLAALGSSRGRRSLRSAGGVDGGEHGGEALAGGGRRVCHVAPATSAPVDHASRTGADGASAMRRRPRPPEAAAWNRCRSRAAGASGQDRWRRSWGGWSSQASNRGRPSACPTAKPAAARPTAFSTVLRLARAAMTCRPRPWDGQRVAPVVPPAGAEVVPAGTVHRGDGAERRVGGHGPDCGGSP